MNSKKSPSRRGNRRSKASSSSGQRFVTKRAMSGGKFTPPTNPPDVTYMPWHPVTLVISHSSNLEFKVNDIKTYLRSQLDPTSRGFNKLDTGDSRFVVQYRVLQVTSWNLTGRVISLAVEDYRDTAANTGGREQICGLVDTGSSLHTPAVGYTLPHSLASHVLRTDDKYAEEYVFIVSAPSGNQCITYVKTLYRFDGPARHPKVLSPLNEIERVVTKISNKISKMNEPSTLELTLNGVKYVAEAVALVGALGECSSIRTSNDAVVKDEEGTSDHLEDLMRQIRLDEENPQIGSDSSSAYEVGVDDLRTP